MKQYPVAALGDVCDIAAGGTPSRSVMEYFDGDIPWVKIGDLAQGRVTSTEERITRRGLAGSAAKLFPSGTVLMSIFATIGRTAVLGIDAATNQAIAGITPRDPRRLDSIYLRHYFDSITANLIKAARGVAQLNINLGILKALPLPLPPIHEQRRIAAILDRAYALKAKRREALAQLGSLTQSIFIEMTQQSSFGVRTMRIGDAMAAIIDYRGKTPTKTHVGVPLVTARVVKNGELLDPNEYIAEADYSKWMRRGLPIAGDVERLISRAPSGLQSIAEETPPSAA